jgi:hypothetical protein
MVSRRGWRGGLTDGAVDLDQAMQIVRSTYICAGPAIVDLIRRVSTPNLLTRTKTLSPASSLHDGIMFRQVEALHLLFWVTLSRD